MKKLFYLGLLLAFCIPRIGIAQSNKNIPFAWENATVYFVLTDRFENGDTSNDFSYGRQRNGPPLRSFEGGDLQGLINKIDSGYFDDLGVNALWVTPPYENIHGSIGGAGYAFHGYWAKDWTTIDRNLGTDALFKTFVDKAHDHGIRIIMDVVLNHVGPDNSSDESWPSEWVRREPTCNFQGPGGSIPCELVDNLPDIRTESNGNVSVPGWLLNKWSQEGRRQQEENELNNFFNRTGYPRAPRFYIMKWLTDYVRDYGVDGFRVDTVKHVEEFVWKELETEGLIALREWKNNNPDKKLDDLDFWMTGEVFGYSAPSMGRRFTGDGFNVDYYDNGFANLINFEFRFNANDGLESIFSRYDNLLQNQLGNGKSAMNFLANHDTNEVFDRNRTRTFEAGTKLLLTPGPAQIYYGDETARTLTPGGGASGDATLRSNMNFNELNNPNSKAALTLIHFQKLGKFRREHVSVGAGKHTKLQDTPYTFKREYNNGGITDKSLVYTGNDGDFSGGLNVFGMWPNGTTLKDYFSDKTAVVSGGSVNFGTSFGLVLIAEPLTISNSASLSVSPASGFYTSAVSVEMAASTTTPGASVNIFYTDDGSTPSSSSTAYNNLFTISENTTIKAIAIDSEGNQSSIITRDYVFGGPFDVYFKKPTGWSSAFIYVFNQSTGAAIPGFPAWPGVAMETVSDTPWYKYNIDQNVQVGIVFNDNGGAQTDDLTRIKNGWYDNQWFDNCSGDCPDLIELPVVSVSPASGSFNGSVDVSMDATNSGSIFYTLDGSMPDSSSTPYTGVFTISAEGSTVVKAIAINTAGNSSIVSRTYTIENVSGYTVNFKKPNNWSTAYIYLYDKNANTAIPGFPGWPGIQMSKLGSSPWYAYTIDQTVEVGIVFNDNGGAQTDDLFRTTSGWYDNQWSDTCPNECPDIVDTSFMVYFKKPNNWNTVYIYIYDKNANDAIPGFPAWPGIQMSKLSSSPWYKYTIDQTVDVGIVFNDNGGAQTDNLFRTTSGWYDNQWFDNCPGECPNLNALNGSFSNITSDNDRLNFISAWPNPFKETLSLSFTKNMNKNNLKIEMYDLSGKLTNVVPDKSTKENTVTIQTSNLSKGIYLLKITSDDNVKMIKVVK
ncbi:starch-binding protein [Aquimarina algiphila]|uniref:starch-binding protein n=1 Tax=Aquimarina algiphila TaxID=2047982 RepID=UPI00232BBB96|nr:starch-binding protein [Aquimarina algiphila]